MTKYSQKGFIILLVVFLIIMGVLIYFNNANIIGREVNYNYQSTYAPNIEWICEDEGGMCICNEEGELELYCGNNEDKYKLVKILKCSAGYSCQNIGNDACACLPK